ncbi:hypothetical protein L596_000887 [Steinernema carpocapsae]|uniref:Uncharacterized protein n=1 Tax=Steinernema carpocapsae TaxID=34508 RepID=A0A4U8UK66_STECR|nr:hypothetical protein L596_000887 [Steinernema carpocapsae]
MRDNRTAHKHSSMAVHRRNAISTFICLKMTDRKRKAPIGNEAQPQQKKMDTEQAVHNELPKTSTASQPVTQESPSTSSLSSTSCETQKLQGLHQCLETSKYDDAKVVNAKMFQIRDDIDPICFYGRSDG